MTAPIMLLTLREIPKFPPPWGYASANRPEERRGRRLARQGFVTLKLVFLRAAADIPGETGQELQRRIRQSSEPIELWLLRAQVQAALPEDEGRSSGHVAAIRHALASVYPVGSPLADDGLR
ncbi:hypothetical protein DBR47_13945 [Paucibacter sp. KBW04]|uniref:hypothetical protein n=1 Tax=Paucibacter sp. KBW04 TaxID=2153361 RepID=UPI000F55CF68|nr:hypothetical protein [Paucibacter sp. KBW04]RQO58765.1 hypothetical protein DBR47_13945 [Paucibacter sp. KBW04]